MVYFEFANEDPAQQIADKVRKFATDAGCDKIYEVTSTESLPAIKQKKGAPPAPIGSY